MLIDQRGERLTADTQDMNNLNKIGAKSVLQASAVIKGTTI
jgi:hypothetical protein